MKFLGLTAEKGNSKFWYDSCLDLVSCSNFFLCGWTCHLIFNEVVIVFIKYTITGIGLLCALNKENKCVPKQNEREIYLLCFPSLVNM